MKLVLVTFGVAVAAAFGGLQQRTTSSPQARGVALSELAWTDAEPWLTASTVVVIPLGGGAVEQGPHMKLDSNERLARYLAARVKSETQVVVAPTLPYHTYAAYADYPGSSTLSENTARDVIADTVRSLAKHGPRRFYILNTSSASMATLSKTAEVVGNDGILLGYTDPDLWTKSPVLKQTRIAAAHADEVATSMMLFVDPSAVDMTRADREYPPGRGVLTRVADGRGVVSKTGILGDATLATAEKGRVLVDLLVSGALDDIEKMRAAPLPAVRTTPPPAPAAARPPAPRPLEVGPRRGTGRCTEGDERAVKFVGVTFTYDWAQMDADAIGGLFAPTGDIRHPDGSVEFTPEVIKANRRVLFTKKEYQGSKHPVELNEIRCVNEDTAIADGKWELRLTSQPSAVKGGLPPETLNKGWCTLMLVKATAGWKIEAWRYTVDPPPNTPLPNTLPRPGFIGRGGDGRIPNP